MILSSAEEIATLRERLSAEGKKVVFTNGVFDILHAGHVTYLEQARELGDVLIIGLNTDDSVKRLKGPDRPVNTESDRAIVLQGLRCVDHVVYFATDTPLALIEALSPQVLVKGADYSVASVVGSEFVLRNGGEVRLIPLLEGRSTTNIINRAQKA